MRNESSDVLDVGLARGELPAGGVGVVGDLEGSAIEQPDDARRRRVHGLGHVGATGRGRLKAGPVSCLRVAPVSPRSWRLLGIRRDQ